MNESCFSGVLDMKDYCEMAGSLSSDDRERETAFSKMRVRTILGPEALAEHGRWLEKWLGILQSNPETSMNSWTYEKAYWETVEMSLYEKLATSYTARMDSRIELHAGEPSLLNNLRKKLFHDEYQYLKGYGNCCAHMVMMGLLSTDYWEERKMGRFEHMDRIIIAIDMVDRNLTLEE